LQSCYADFNRAQDTTNNISNGDKLLVELHVLVAETAFRTENYSIARTVMERFLQVGPQQDRFYCRAKVLLGLLINHECRHMNGNESIKWHKYAVTEIMTAIDISINPKNVNRYKFLIFNISVAFWKVVHPYLRANRAKFFAAEIKRVVTALEEQNDADKDWRIMYLSAAAVCSEDDKNTATATEQVDRAIEHADALLQLTLTEEERLNKILKDASTEKDRIMIAFRAIEEQEILRNKPKKIDPDAPPDDPNAPPEPRILPPLTGLAAEGYDKVKSQLDVSQARKAAADTDLRVVVDRRNLQLETLLRLYLQRVSVNPADAKRFSTLPNVLKYIRASTLVTAQCMLVNAITDKEWEATLTGLVKKLSETPASMVRNETLADLARIAWRLKQRRIAIQCCDLALEGNIVSKILKVKTDICASLKALADLTSDSANQVTGSRLSIKQAEGFFTTKRIEAIKSLESALQACGKIENNQYLVQEICVSMWNAMTPLLQPHLRQRVHSALKSMAAALRTVSSPLAQLRMEVHAELAKCEDASKAVVSARDEALNALNADYGALDKDATVNASNSRDGPSTIATAGVGALSPNDQSLDRNRPMDLYILPYLNLLELRCLVYDSPADVEGQALLWLHQAKESKLKPFILDNVSKALFLMMDLLCLAKNCTATSEGEGEEETKQELSNINQTLKRNAAGVIDFNALVAAKGPMVIPQVPLEHLEKVVAIARTGDKFTQFTPVLQLHHRIMYTIVTLGHVLENVALVQQAAMFVLRPVWDPADPFVRELIDAQVHVQYLVADNLVVRIKSVPFKKTVVVKDPLLDVPVEDELPPEEEAARSVDPRCLGFQSEEVQFTVSTFFRLVCPQARLRLVFYAGWGRNPEFEAPGGAVFGQGTCPGRHCQGCLRSAERHYFLLEPARAHLPQRAVQIRHRRGSEVLDERSGRRGRRPGLSRCCGCRGRCSCVGHWRRAGPFRPPPAPIFAGDPCLVLREQRPAHRGPGDRQQGRYPRWGRAGWQARQGRPRGGSRGPKRVRVPAEENMRAVQPPVSVASRCWGGGRQGSSQGWRASSVRERLPECVLRPGAG